MRIITGVSLMLASAVTALAADHPDAIRYSQADRAAMNALVQRTCPPLTLREQPDIVQQVLDAAAADYLKRKGTAQ